MPSVNSIGHTNEINSKKNAMPHKVSPGDSDGGNPPMGCTHVVPWTKPWRKNNNKIYDYMIDAIALVVCCGVLIISVSIFAPFESGSTCKFWISKNFYCLKCPTNKDINTYRSFKHQISLSPSQKQNTSLHHGTPLHQGGKDFAAETRF